MTETHTHIICMCMCRTMCLRYDRQTETNTDTYTHDIIVYKFVKKPLDRIDSILFMIEAGTSALHFWIFCVKSSGIMRPLPSVFRDIT